VTDVLPAEDLQVVEEGGVGLATVPFLAGGVGAGAAAGGGDDGEKGDENDVRDARHGKPLSLCVVALTAATVSVQGPLRATADRCSKHQES